MTANSRWASALTALLLLAGAGGPAKSAVPGPGRVATPSGGPSMEEPMVEYRKPTDEEIRRRLTPEQHEVVCNEGTEPPFQNAYWDHREPGIYVDVVTGEPLFGSLDKFDSGTGWPSFTRPLDPGHVVTREDRTLFSPRTEVRSAQGDSHLGHLFPDGPAPTGQRYCINSASLRFVPVDRLEAEGYGRFLPLFGGSRPSGPDAEPALERATLAGGCFWGMEGILRNVPGVIETRVGYTGGDLDAPRYQDVKTGKTGHAESVEVVFDPTRLGYEELLERWFFRMHDPTTRDRQGNDVGSRYRSAIFVHSVAQRWIAEAVRDRVEKSGKWKRPVVTEIVTARPFWPAEEFHQDYLLKNPGGYTCHWLRN